ncbi:helix-turn-helix domain-containing protein [Borreliella burgdorferi]
MSANKVYKYRIYSNTNQIFLKVFRCVRFLYSKMLSDRRDYYKRIKKS